MKQIQLFILLISLSVSSNGQTVQETQEWLKYNLNKFYGDNHSHNFNLANNAPYGIKSEAFMWQSYDYDFINNDFIITETSYEKKLGTGDQVTYSRRKFVINLRLIIKVENESRIDTSTFFKKFQDNSRFALQFVFKNRDDKNEKSVKEFNLLNDENFNLSTGYFTKYNFQMQTDFKNVNTDIPIRIITALTFLVERSGGKIIKDVF